MRAAVIDIGSNSIKVLVADRGADGQPAEVLSRTLEVRISQGLGAAAPRLSAEGMARGVQAVATLADQARGLGATVIGAVATSAVRDAANGAEFRRQVQAATGVEVRILSGDTEADLIGRGLTTDPALAGLQDFRVFDLGGGSLECLSFRARRVDFETSLRLGCVRLTEQLVEDPAAPLPAPTRQRIEDEVERQLAAARVPRGPAAAAVIGTGGTLTTVRAIRAAAGGVPFADSDPVLPVALLRETLDQVGALPLAGRRAVPGLAASRADVFPTALVTLLALARWAEVSVFLHSLRNLRWGAAAELLDRG
jgi:exopolyphosphatase/guanosine-5'-triphosphate,3'-diphosphate pyrophosphatase